VPVALLWLRHGRQRCALLRLLLLLLLSHVRLPVVRRLRRPLSNGGVQIERRQRIILCRRGK
jgi:hypothetical protein